MVGCHTRSQCGTVQAILRTPRSLSEERAIRGRSLELLAKLGLFERADEPAASLSFGESKLWRSRGRWQRRRAFFCWTSLPPVSLTMLRSKSENSFAN